MKYPKRRNRNVNRLMADINVTPLVDVMLVLLIIFMVTAPMLQMGIEAKSVDVAEEKLVLSINAAKEIFLNKSRMTLNDLGTELEHVFASRIDREIYMRADRNVPYGFVVEVMAAVRKAGVDKLGMITDPPEEPM
jgi:biopolymer transport protein TolR